MSVAMTRVPTLPLPLFTFLFLFLVLFALGVTPALAAPSRPGGEPPATAPRGDESPEPSLAALDEGASASLQAMRLLVLRGEAARPGINARLQDDSLSPRARATCAWLLDALGPVTPASARALVQAHTSAPQGSSLEHVTRRLLQEQHPAAAAALSEALLEQRGETRAQRSLILILSRQGPLGAEGLALGLDAEVVQSPWIARVLAGMGSDAAPALPALVRALRSEDPELRRHAQASLKGIGWNLRASGGDSCEWVPLSARWPTLLGACALSLLCAGILRWRLALSSTPWEGAVCAGLVGCLGWALLLHREFSLPWVAPSLGGAPPLTGWLLGGILSGQVVWWGLVLWAFHSRPRGRMSRNDH